MKITSVTVRKIEKENSRMKGIAEILFKEGYIKAYEEIKDEIRNMWVFEKKI